MYVRMCLCIYVSMHLCIYVYMYKRNIVTDMEYFLSLQIEQAN